jgi:hypothetical protein
VGARIGFMLAAALAGTVILLSATSGAWGKPTAAQACPAGTKRVVVGGNVKCVRAGQKCKAKYQAAYKKVGLTCVTGRLRKRPTPPPPAPTPEPPPPAPPPPPPAQPGHYHGLTSQLTTVDMDVTSDGATVTNIRTGQINQGCTPPAHIFGGGITDATRTVASDGTFLVDFTFDGTFSDGTAYNGRITMTGKFTAATASGTLSATLNFVDNGIAFACGSGQQTWTASRTG